MKFTIPFGMAFVIFVAGFMTLVHGLIGGGMEILHSFDFAALPAFLVVASGLYMAYEIQRGAVSL